MSPAHVQIYLDNPYESDAGKLDSWIPPRSITDHPNLLKIGGRHAPSGHLHRRAADAGKLCRNLVARSTASSYVGR